MSSNRPHDGDPLAPHRGRLLGLAYRMLGSRSDAEDVVQDAYLRFAGAQDVHNAEAFLVTIVTRLCLDRLKSAKAQREIYVGPWLPEPVFDAEGLSAEAATELADDLSFALLLALDRLSPMERAAFLLHDVFDTPFPRSPPCSAAPRRPAGNWPQEPVARCATIAPHLRRRRTVTRACCKLSATRLPVATSGTSRRTAARGCGGAHGRRRPQVAARNPIIGADKVARFFIGIAGKTPAMTSGSSPL